MPPAIANAKVFERRLDADNSTASLSRTKLSEGP